MNIDDWKRALKIHEKQRDISIIDLKYENLDVKKAQWQMDIAYAEFVIEAIKSKIKELEKNAPVCPSKGN